MAALTQSGYPVIGGYGDPAIDTSASVHGVAFPGGIRKGDVTTILLYVAGRWHTEVEHLIDGHCWGYTHKTITGGSGWSNHAGACAIDINAPEHPQHTYTLTHAEIKAAHNILAAVSPVVRWGGDWTPASVDEMHWEINLGMAGSGKVKALAAKIHAGKVPNVPAELLNEGVEVTPSKPVVKPSKPKPKPSKAPGGVTADGVSVKQVQLALNRHGANLAVDNVWGPKTSAAVRAFQKREGLKQDSYVGPRTWAALVTGTGTPFPLSGGQVFGTWNEPGWAKRTRSGDPRWDGDDIRADVKRIQKAVGVKADGIYGVKTRAAVVKAQHKHGLVQDGLCGKSTWKALGL